MSITGLPAADGQPHHYVAADFDTLVDSPMWNLVLRYSSNITITNYHVQNYSDAAATIPAGSTGPNTDGIDPVGSSFITISNIDVQVGDDDVEPVAR